MLDGALIPALVLKSCLGGFPYQSLACTRIVFTRLCLPGLRKMNINPPGLASHRKTNGSIPCLEPSTQTYPSFAQCSLFTKLFILHRSRSCQVGKESGLGGDNFYLDFSPSLCTQFKMTKQEESLISVVVVVVVLSKGKTLLLVSICSSHCHGDTHSSIPGHQVTLPPLQPLQPFSTMKIFHLNLLLCLFLTNSISVHTPSPPICSNYL